MIRRRARARHRGGFALHLAAMIDVVFLLMLYFLLTMDFAGAEEAFAVDLPRGAGSDDPFALPEQPVLITVETVEGAARLRVDAPELAAATTPDALAAALDGGTLFGAERRFVVEPSRATWTHALEAFNAVLRGGHERVRFAERRR